MLIVVIIIIAVISIAWAFWSFRSIQKGFISDETRKKLQSERVIFHSSDVPSVNESIPEP